MALSEAQRILNSFGKFEGTMANKSFTIYGKRGTIISLGLTPEALAGDLGDTGVSRLVHRPGGNRSRWLGDTGGPSYAASDATVLFYPGRSGNALPGRPFRFSLAGDTYTVNQGGQQVTKTHKWSLNIEGPWGAFVAYMIENRPPADLTLWTPSGKRHEPDILHIDPQG